MLPFLLTKISKMTGFFRSLVGVMAALLLSLQFVVPNIGQAATGGDWIEICSEFGVVEIQVDASQEDETDCSECDTCVMCNAQGPSILAATFSTAELSLSKTIVSKPATSALMTNPAQFWHVSRGPPDLNKIAMARVFGASVVTTQTKEVALWT